MCTITVHKPLGSTLKIPFFLLSSITLVGKTTECELCAGSAGVGAAICSGAHSRLKQGLTWINGILLIQCKTIQGICTNSICNCVVWLVNFHVMYFHSFHCNCKSLLDFMEQFIILKKNQSMNLCVEWTSGLAAHSTFTACQRVMRRIWTWDTRGEECR